MGDRIESMQLLNYKAFEDTGLLRFGNVNVLVGPNNAGKSSILQALRHLQDGAPFEPGSVHRIGGGPTQVLAEFTGSNAIQAFTPDTSRFDIDLGEPISISSGGGRSLRFSHGAVRDNAGTLAPSQEPANVFYQYLSKRKVHDLSQEVNLTNTMSVSGDLRHLVAKVARLSSHGHPQGEAYLSACQEIVGFPIAPFASEHGQRIGRAVTSFDYIPIESMGEGVASLVGLIVDLCIAEGRIFLIEEPENDLHPRALKRLLAMVASKADTNQFIVSTHSNIVVRHLASLPGSKLFRVEHALNDRQDTSSVVDITEDTEARHATLIDLGYELFDAGLYEGWIIFEEASAESIVRDYLIPWFHPRLSRVRTISTRGTSRVRAAFEELHRVFLYTHLAAEIYHDRSFVLVDGDATGVAAVQQLREQFPSWDPSCFATFSEQDFEQYFPERFAADRELALARSSKDERKKAKYELLRQVRAWCDSDPQTARAEFEVAAAEVIEHLARIENAILDRA